MDKRQRHRRAVNAAIALLEWRDHMARELAARQHAEREMELRFFLMLAAMRLQADEPHTAS